MCSGTATSSANGDVVTTAGHCVNEGPGAFVTNFAFVPAYDNGAAPYGTWTGRDAAHHRPVAQRRATSTTTSASR